jgi:hypothetical protein
LYIDKKYIDLEVPEEARLQRSAWSTEESLDRLRALNAETVLTQIFDERALQLCTLLHKRMQQSSTICW